MLLQPAKAAKPIFERLVLAALKSTVVIAAFSNALSPIDLSEPPANVIVESFVQPANALLPIEFVPFCLNPNVTDSRFVQFSNAWFPLTYPKTSFICLRPFGFSDCPARWLQSAGR